MGLLLCFLISELLLFALKYVCFNLLHMMPMLTMLSKVEMLLKGKKSIRWTIMFGYCFRTIELLKNPRETRKLSWLCDTKELIASILKCDNGSHNYVEK